MITPNQIKEKQLSTAAHGYDIEETNSFLNEITDSFSAVVLENKELYRKMEILANKIVEYREEEDAIKEAILSAQKTAGSIEKDAREKAEKLAAESRETAEKTVNDAKAEAEKLISEARDYVANLTKEKTAAANEIQTEAENKASKVLSNAKNAVSDMFSQTKALSDELIEKAKQEKEYHENLVSKLKKESEDFKSSIIALYEAQLASVREMLASPVENAKNLAAEKLSEIEEKLKDSDKFVEDITKETEIEAAAGETANAEEKAEEPAPQPEEKKAPAAEPVKEEAPAEEEKPAEAPAEETPVIAVNEAEIEEIESEQKDEPSMIDVDLNSAIDAFDKDELTPVEGVPVTEITEEPEMEPAAEPEKEYNDELPFESFFNVKAEGRTNEKISLIPPDDFEEEEDLKFRGFFKKKNKNKN